MFKLILFEFWSNGGVVVVEIKEFIDLSFIIDIVLKVKNLYKWIVEIFYFYQVDLFFEIEFGKKYIVF